ncbi:MAG: PD40 domain-containing protein [Clostridia bacterium]|nr:PD40 domain-containing protein [Clostridia bacterium]
MAGIGTVIPSEMTTYIDKKSGIEITKLTNSGTNVHLYFTDNSFTLGDNEIIYKRKEGGVMDKDAYELFAMDLTTGVSVQLTDFGSRFKKVDWVTKSPDSRYITFIGDGDLYVIDRKMNETRLLYRCPFGFSLGSPSISHDCRYVAIVANDEEGDRVRSRYSHENYGGFKEAFYAHKNGNIIIANMDGSGGEVVFKDTHWVGHIQFAPDTNEFITYCHEGPWNYVQQRIWMLNTITRTVKPCFVQAEDDSIGHEFWTRDGLVFFDNRGKGHDGTITSNKTQAVTVTEDSGDAIPWVGFADKDCNLVRSLEVPYYCNHYHANTDNSLLVADAVEDIVLIDISGEKAEFKILCEHDTSWRWQEVHCHPCWSWSNDKILFASDRDAEGYPQLYMVKMK